MNSRQDSIPGFWVFALCSMALIGAFGLSWLVLFTGMMLGDALSVFFP